MKVLYFITVIGMLLAVGTNEIQAQYIRSQLKHAGQFPDNRKADVGQSFDDMLLNADLKPRDIQSIQTPDSIVYSSLIWVGDSSQWFVYDKDEYDYDAKGNMISWIGYKLDERTNKLVFDFKDTHTYNASRKETSWINYEWDTTTSKWFGTVKYEFTYDASGYMTKYVRYSPDWQTNQLVAAGKHEFTNNSFGMPVLRIIYSWDKYDNKWNALQKWEYSYNSSGNLTLVTYCEWSKTANDWEKIFGKDVYTYNDKGMTSKISYILDANTNQFNPRNKDEYTYDDNRNMTVMISYNIDSNTGQWIGYYKKEYDYDANRNTILFIYYDGWDATTSQFIIPSYKFDYTYNDSGNIASAVFYAWDAAFSQWSLPSAVKTEYTYDAAGNTTFHFELYWDGNASKWKVFKKATYYYPWQNSTSIPVIPNMDISVYPNPAKEFIVFDLPNISESSIVEIFDIHGTKILEQRLTDNKQVFLGNLNKGLYLFRIHNRVNVYEGKIVVD